MVSAGRVLVIDDDHDFVTSVRILLASQGYQVVEAFSGRDGLDKLREFRPDVIILDVMMETDSEGYSVNETIKFDDAYAEFRSIPIFMVSAIQETPDQRFPRAPEVGMIRPDRYLTKPLDVEELLDVMAGVRRR